MRLHIGMLRSKEFTSPLTGKLFRGLHYLAPSVVLFMGIPFGIFVGKYRALSFQHRAGYEVLRSDEFHSLSLSLHLPTEKIVHFRIRLLYPSIHKIHICKQPPSLSKTDTSRKTDTSFSGYAPEEETLRISPTVLKMHVRAHLRNLGYQGSR
jgi:hypothetical protein